MAKPKKAELDLGHVWAAMTGESAPTVRSVAVGLSRVPRWLGRTIRPWSVLQHTLAADALAAGEKPMVRLAVLLHDAEEAVMGDIPTPVKTAEQCALGERIRQDVYSRAVGLPYPKQDVLERVEFYDEVIQGAEAHALLPWYLREFFPEPPAEPSRVIYGVLDMTPREQVHAFERLVESMLAQPTILALKGR